MKKIFTCMLALLITISIGIYGYNLYNKHVFTKEISKKVLETSTLLRKSVSIEIGEDKVSHKYKTIILSNYISEVEKNLKYTKLKSKFLKNKFSDASINYMSSSHNFLIKLLDAENNKTKYFELIKKSTENLHNVKNNLSSEGDYSLHFEEFIQNNNSINNAYDEYVSSSDSRIKATLDLANTIKNIDEIIPKDLIISYEGVLMLVEFFEINI